MTALEIVLVSLIGVIATVIAVYFLAMWYFKRFVGDQSQEFYLYDNYRVKGSTIFLGDSLTDFYPLEEFFAGENVLNRGIAGDKTTDVLARIEEVKAMHPQKLFLQIGINDMIYHGKKKDGEILARVEKILNSFDKTRTQRYLLSLYPVNRRKVKFAGFVIKHANNARICRMNERYKALAERLDVPFIDLYPALTDEKGNLKSEYTLEGLHLSAEGYRVITASLKEYVCGNE